MLCHEAGMWARQGAQTIEGATHQQANIGQHHIQLGLPRGVPTLS